MASSTPENTREQTLERVRTLVTNYKDDPNQHNAEVILALFKPLIEVYVYFLATGKYRNAKGRVIPSLRGILRLVNVSWIPSVFERYSLEDLRQEVNICVLDVARDKPHVVNALPYRIKQMIRDLTKDISVRQVVFGVETTEHNPISTLAYGRDDVSAIDLLARLDLTREERFLVLKNCVDQEEHGDITRAYNRTFGTTYSRRRISEKIVSAKEKVATQLRPYLEDGSIHWEKGAIIEPAQEQIDNGS